MSNSSSDDELIALENTHARLNFRKEGVHPINRKRREYGEYHHLFIELKKDNQKFFEYMRMTQDTFYYILNKIEHRLAKTWNNWHRQPILQEERLVITLR